VVEYKDGFTLRSRDKRNELKLQASAQLDSRFYMGESVAPHSFDIRRARFDFNAKLLEFMSIRLQAALEDNPYIRNAILDLKACDAFHFRVGQMKVPFSSEWLTLDNQVNFLERAAAEPIYPFFDRGAMIWGDLAGQAVTYNLGIYNGNGVDLDGNKGDIDGSKDVAGRFFLQPFRNAGLAAIEGIYLVGQGTHGLMSVPTRRFETRGMATPNYESLAWRWRTEQVIGTNGRNTDSVAAEVGSKSRLGAELHYLYGPFALSLEWAVVRYKDITIYHDFYQGSKRLMHEAVARHNGGIHSASAWASLFLTGEKKTLDNFGWRQPTPKSQLAPGSAGTGAWELLGRFSATIANEALFDKDTKTSGYKASALGLSGTAASGEGGSVTPAVLEGAQRLYEVTGGVNWTLNYHARWQLNYTYLWAPRFEDGGEKEKGGIISGGNSELWDATVKNRMVKSEHSLGLRIIFRI
jgi:phosphate-selective porin